MSVVLFLKEAHHPSGLLLLAGVNVSPSRVALRRISAMRTYNANQDFTLCPWKVPIQSPLAPFLSMGNPSLLALVRKYPSGVTGLHAQDCTF